MPPAPRGRAWPELMRIALNAAMSAAQAGDVPVGAVLAAQSGRVLAACANRVERDSDPTAHAEMLAIRAGARLAASPRLTGCVLVATLEPCAMCAGAIAHARLDGVVYGAADAREGAIISRRDADPRTFWHMGGVLAEDCAALLRDFFARRR